ncbi:MAG: GH25 family lysozyme [Eubacteriales bacterium]|nr:GH25 family lysozyme [Eubacteriales bacterium]
MKKFLGMKILSAILAAVVAVSSVGAGGYVIYGYESLPDQIETARVVETQEPEEEPEEEIVEEEIPEEEPEEQEEAKELSLVCTSIEKDLKIKIQDQNAKLVTGETFTVSVKSDKKNAKESEYTDKDKDGVIYIDKLDAGKYTVALLNAEGYEVKTGTVQATVKDKIEYKKVDVKSEIKTESQVNTAVEDTAVNNVPQESTLTDTVALLESTVKTSRVAKADVDTSNFTKASASGEKATVTLSKTVTETKPTEPEKPVEPDKPTEPVEPEKPTEPEKPVEPVEPEKPTEPTDPDETTDPEPTPDQGGTGSGGETDEGAAATISAGEAQTLSLTDGAGSGAKASAGLLRAGSGNAALSASSGRAAGAVFLAAAAAQPAAASEKAADTTKTVTASVSIPSGVTLYQGGGSASNSYGLSLAVTGESSLIQKVTWSADAAVSLSASSGNSVTVTAKSVGTATVKAVITYTKDGQGGTAEASLTTKVTVNNFSDGSVVLKDKSGNTLYLDSSAQKTATLKDYASTDTFYTSPKYTGWQTIGGKVYYYNENHQALTGNQVIGGVMYTFSGDGSLSQSSGNRGIDVSKYQGNIDWGAVAASGINFAIIRVGYRGSSTGALIEDPYFKKNISGATKAGIKVGVYFFTQAVNEAEAVEEASMAMSLVSGYRMTYPIFIDTESASNGRANGLSKSARTAVVKAFCQTVRNGGYKAGIYASKSWYNNQLDASSLSSYCIWVAQYNSSCTYSGKYDMWQYSSKGSVSGIKGNVDMNISYTGY